MGLTKLFTKMAGAVSKAAGRPLTFVICLGLVLTWAVSGPIFKFSETWQLLINTGTTIITFLMVFLIQNTQNRDSAALHAKLDELIRVSRAENAFIGIERLTDHELEAILKECEKNAPELRKIVKDDTPRRPGGDKAAKTLRKIAAAEVSEREGRSGDDKPSRAAKTTKPAAKRTTRRKVAAPTRS